MYLMDSISKNIGSPYTELWAPRVVTLFMETYRIVDQPTRRRLEVLLSTWRAAGPGGRPLYGDSAQWTIERSLFGNQGPTAKPAEPSKAQVLANLDRLLAHKTQERSQQPGNQAVVELIETLQTLKTTVQNSETNPEIIADVQKELDAINARTQGQHSTPAQATPPPAANSGTEGPGTQPSASDLIANLMRAGLLPSAQSAPSAPVHVSQDKSYTEFILSLDMRLTSADLARPPPDLELLVKENLPLQCRQCANRYPDDVAGKHGRDQHLDWHFSQSRRARASIARGQSRSWLDPVKRWVRSGFDDVHVRSSDDADTLMTSPAQEQALKEKFANTHVVVPDDPEIAARLCRICKEKFQSEWSEEVEEWIWKNAVEIDGVYYHASCYYSAKSMSESVKTEETAKAESGSVGFDVPPEEPSEANPFAQLVASLAAAARPLVKSEDEEAPLKRKASSSPSPPHKKTAGEEGDA